MHEKNLPQQNLCNPRFHHPRWDLSSDRGLKRHPTLSLQKWWQKIFRRKLFLKLLAAEVSQIPSFGYLKTCSKKIGASSG
jgi:hypothetical protein